MTLSVRLPTTSSYWSSANLSDLLQVSDTFTHLVVYTSDVSYRK